MRYVGTELDARMTVIRLAAGGVLIHSPCEIDAQARQAILAIGPVAAIVAPGMFHHPHVRSAQVAFRGAKTLHLSRGGAKSRELRYDAELAEPLCRHSGSASSSRFWCVAAAGCARWPSTMAPADADPGGPDRERHGLDADRELAA